jgi:hypothetical protein
MAVPSTTETRHVCICCVCAGCWCFNKKQTRDIGGYHSGVTEGDVTPIRCVFSSRRFERSYCPHPNAKQSKRIRWNLKMKKVWSFETSEAADPVTRRHIFVNTKVCIDVCDWLKCFFVIKTHQIEILWRSVQCKVLNTVNTTRRQSGWEDACLPLTVRWCVSSACTPHTADGSTPALVASHRHVAQLKLFPVSIAMTCDGTLNVAAASCAWN